MKYYRLSNQEIQEEIFINSKNDLSDEEVFEQALDEGLVDVFGFDDYTIDEISEEEYEESA